MRTPVRSLIIPFATIAVFWVVIIVAALTQPRPTTAVNAAATPDGAISCLLRPRAVDCYCAGQKLTLRLKRPTALRCAESWRLGPAATGTQVESTCRRNK